MNKKKVYYIIGILLLALGIRFIIDANLGAAPWDLLCIALFDKTGISIGTWQIINNILMIVLTRVLLKEKWNLICLIPGVLLGICIDIIGMGLDVSMLPNILILCIGCLLSGVGLVVYMGQNISANAIDNFTFCLSKKMKISTSVTKIICDAIPLVLILVLQTQIQLGTAFVYVLVPICMRVTQRVRKFKRINETQRA